MSYEKYIKLKEKYKNPEYLYFGNINIKDLITEEDLNKVKKIQEIQEMMTALI